MSLQLRRGTETDRLSIVPLEGEPIWQTNDNTLWMGDGSTAGGVAVGGGSTGDIRFSGNWIKNKDTGDIYISPQDGNTGVYFPSDSSAGGSAVEIFNVDTTGTVRIDAGSKNWTFSHDGSLTVPGNIDGAEGYTANMTGFRAGWYAGTSGYSFKNDSGQDTGMFSWGDGDLRLRANNDDVLQMTTAQAQFNKDVLLNGVSLKFNEYASISHGAYNDIVINVGDSAVRINGDQGVIIGDGTGSSQIDVNQITGIGINPLNVACVLKVGDGEGNAYITTRGDWPLILQTSDNNGPGASIVLSSGEYGTVELFAGNNQETQLANFNTGTGATIFLPTTINGQTTLVGTNENTYPASLPLKIQNYTIDSSSVSSFITQTHRGTQATPASVQTGDIILQAESIPYTDAWANSDVFGYLAGSPLDGYSYGPIYNAIVSQNFSESPLYFNHVEGYHQFLAFNPPDAYHPGTTVQVNYQTQFTGNKFKTLNTDFGDTFAGLDSTVQITPTKSDTTEVPFIFSAEGTVKMPVLTAAPATLAAGIFAVADGLTWDPATYSTTTAYMAFYNGSAWVALG